jgi:NADPH:quinone reductase-like Zn-dependent oxidoreductase
MKYILKLFTATEILFEKMSDDMTFTEAASMPMIFVTAIYSLINIGRLEKNQSVLIHSGCGDVGLAAIQVARMVGAEIYTTVGSEENVAYLMEKFKIPRNRIFDSRSISFANDILHETQGKGVNLALNSLSGELLHATWRCIAKWGTMVEIGKRDLLGAGKLDIDIFLANRSYCYVDVDQMRDERPEILER